MAEHWTLPDQAVFESPIYIHSHWYSFYNQVGKKMMSHNISSALTDWHNDTIQTLNSNISILEEVHNQYANAGIQMELIDLSDSFRDVAERKAETLIRNTTRNKIHKARELYTQKLFKVIDDWLNSPNVLNDKVVEDIATIIFNDLSSINVTKTDTIKKLKTRLKSWYTLSEGNREKILKYLVKYFVNEKTWMQLGLFSEIDKLSEKDRRKNIYTWLNNLSSDTVWTPKNAASKIHTIKALSDELETHGSIFDPGARGIVGAMIGHAFEIRLAQELKKYSDTNLAGKVEGDKIIISEDGPDIVSQAMQAAEVGITTDVDLGITLKGLENFSYGFSAKTSIYGLTVGADTEHLNIPATDEKTWRFLFYLLLNYHALRKESKPNPAAMGSAALSATDGFGFVDSIIKAVYMYEAVVKILGKCFVETDLSNQQNLLELMNINGGKPISLPIILSFPGAGANGQQNIYTKDLIEQLVEILKQKADAAFNEKYLASIDLKEMWEQKAKIIAQLQNDSKIAEGDYYPEIYSKLDNKYMVTLSNEEKNPFQGKWFVFNTTYNANWLPKDLQ